MPLPRRQRCRVLRPHGALRPHGLHRSAIPWAATTLGCGDTVGYGDFTCCDNLKGCDGPMLCDEPIGCMGCGGPWKSTRSTAYDSTLEIVHLAVGARLPTRVASFRKPREPCDLAAPAGGWLPSERPGPSPAPPPRIVRAAARARARRRPRHNLVGAMGEVRGQALDERGRDLNRPR